MDHASLRQQMFAEISRIPDDRIEELYDLVHFFRIGLEFAAQDAKPRHRPSPRLAYQGASLHGDDLAPAIPEEDWGMLSSQETLLNHDSA